MEQPKAKRLATSTTEPDAESIIATDADYEALVRIGQASGIAVEKAMRQFQQEARRTRQPLYPNRKPK